MYPYSNCNGTRTGVVLFYFLSIICLAIFFFFLFLLYRVSHSNEPAPHLGGRLMLGIKYITEFGPEISTDTIFSWQHANRIFLGRCSFEFVSSATRRQSTAAARARLELRIRENFYRFARPFSFTHYFLLWYKCLVGFMAQCLFTKMPFSRLPLPLLEQKKNNIIIWKTNTACWGSQYRNNIL